MYAHTKPMLIRQRSDCKDLFGSEYRTYAHCSIFASACSITALVFGFCTLAGSTVFLNNNLLEVCLVDEEHLVTYDLSMQDFLCGINVPHDDIDEYAQSMISFFKIRADLIKNDGCMPSILDLVY